MTNFQGYFEFCNLRLWDRRSIRRYAHTPLSLKELAFLLTPRQVKIKP